MATYNWAFLELFTINETPQIKAFNPHPLSRAGIPGTVIDDVNSAGPSFNEGKLLGVSDKIQQPGIGIFNFHVGMGNFTCFAAVQLSFQSPSCFFNNITPSVYVFQ
jgi:hypothetical protein